MDFILFCGKLQYNHLAFQEIENNCNDITLRSYKVHVLLNQNILLFLSTLSILFTKIDTNACNSFSRLTEI